MAKPFDPSEWEEVTPAPAPQAQSLDPSEWEEVPQGDAPADPFAPLNWTPPPKVDLGEAILRGGAQGASAGFADEITGAFEAAVDKLGGAKGPLAERYRVRRDESRAKYDAAKKDRPVAFGLSEAGGALATALVPGAAAAQGARFGVTAARAAIQGAAAGVGASEADLTKGEVTEVVGDALKGAAYGGAGGVVAGWAGKKAGAWAGKAPERVEDAATAGLKNNVQNSTKVKIFGPPGAEDSIREMLETTPGLRKAVGRDTDRAMELVRARAARNGAEIDEIYDASQKAVGNVKLTGADARLGALEDRLRETIAEEPMADAVAALRARLTLKYPDGIPFQALRKEYRAVQNQGFAGSAMFEVSAAKQLKRDMSSAMRDALQDAVEEASAVSGKTKSALRAANREAGALADIETLLDQQSKRTRSDAPTLMTLLTRPVSALAGAAAGPASRGADVLLAKYVAALRAGKPAAEYAARAAAAGVPRSVIDGIAQRVGTKRERDDGE